MKVDAIRICKNCGKEFVKPEKYGLSQWSKKKFCSINCAADAKRVKDGLTRQERYARKIGRTKQGSPAWLDRIREKTKEAMQRPDVKEKICKPKGPMSMEGRIIRSDALVGKMPKNTVIPMGMFIHIQKGDYECSKGTMYFRSKWEANYALYLDFLVKQGQIKDWEYEPETFFFDKIKLGTRTYRPDFKVHYNNGNFIYHEVKGYMDSKSKTKLKRMEKYFPEVEIILIEYKQYTEIIRKLKGVIKFY